MRRALERLAVDLAEAWKSGQRFGLPALEDAPMDRTEAYAVQDRMAELIGEPVAGWKVGAGLKAVQRLEGHDAPVPGRIFASRCVGSPARVPAHLYASPKVECEFAFRLTRAPTESRRALRAQDVADMVVFLPAIEISCSRYCTTGRQVRTADTVADNGSGGGAVLGPAIAEWRHLAFESMAIDARIDGGPPLQAYAGDFRGNPLEVLAATIVSLKARGISLNEGDVVLTGALTVPTPLDAGQQFVARFGDAAVVELTLT